MQSCPWGRAPAGGRATGRARGAGGAGRGRSAPRSAGAVPDPSGPRPAQRAPGRTAQSTPSSAVMSPWSTPTPDRRRGWGGSGALTAADGVIPDERKMYEWITAAFQHFFNNVQKDAGVQRRGLRACRQLLAYILREIDIQRSRIADGQPIDDTMLTRLLLFQLGRSAATVTRPADLDPRLVSDLRIAENVMGTIVGAVAGQLVGRHAEQLAGVRLVELLGDRRAEADAHPRRERVGALVAPAPTWRWSIRLSLSRESALRRGRTSERRIARRPSNSEITPSTTTVRTAASREARPTCTRGAPPDRPSSGRRATRAQTTGPTSSAARATAQRRNSANVPGQRAQGSACVQGNSRLGAHPLTAASTIRPTSLR